MKAYKIAIYNYSLGREVQYYASSLEDLTERLRCLALVPHLGELRGVKVVEW